MRTVALFLLAVCLPLGLLAQKEVESAGKTAVFYLPDDYSAQRRGNENIIIDCGIENTSLTFTELNMGRDDFSLEEMVQKQCGRITSFAGQGSDLTLEVITDEKQFPVNGLECRLFEGKVTDSRQRGVYGIMFAYKNGTRLYLLIGLCRLGRLTDDLRDAVVRISESVEGR